jgi:hypothetical protein
MCKWINCDSERQNPDVTISITPVSVEGQGAFGGDMCGIATYDVAPDALNGLWAVRCLALRRSSVGDLF